MTQRDKHMYGLLPKDQQDRRAFQNIGEQRGEWRLNRYMVVQLHFDRESFTELKELLRTHSHTVRTVELSPQERRTRDALRKIFDQIRDMEYSDV